MYYVYALKSLSNNDLYIGYSKDLRTRFEAHNKGKVRSTKSNKPWELVYYEAYKSKDDARKREYQLKQSCYKEDLKKRLKESLRS
jgi:putative endonuclease